MQVCAQLYTGMQPVYNSVHKTHMYMLERFTKINVYVHSNASLYAYEHDSLYGRVYIHYVNYCISIMSIIASDDKCYIVFKLKICIYSMDLLDFMEFYIPANIL